jgi:signal peptidase I
MKKKRRRKVKAAVIGAGLMCAIIMSCRYMVGRFDVRYIVSGSMLPKLKIGAVCVIDRKAKHPKKGQIACYIREGDSLLVTHRVTQKDGKSYTFRGDANRDSDLPVSQNQIYGTVVFHTNAAAGIIGKKVEGRMDKAIVKK